MRAFLFIIHLFLVATIPDLTWANRHIAFAKLLKNIPIKVVAPASGINKGELATLKSLVSLRLNIPKGTFDQRQSIFHANSDSLRFKYLKDALLDDPNLVVWCLRGGYGSAKLIPALLALPVPVEAKIFIGYSDITALHIFLTQEWGWKTIHGAGIVEMIKSDKDPANFTKIAQIIAKKIDQATIEQLVPINQVAQYTHVIKGKLTGGNITVLQTSIGTSWQVKTNDKILFLEDTHIKAYQLDRSLLHFTQCGLLKDIKSIIFGCCGDDNKDIMDTLKNFASTLAIPVFKTNRFGHGAVNDPIIYNTASQIVRTREGIFKLVMKV